MTDTVANDIMNTGTPGGLRRRSYSGRGMMGERTTAIVGLYEDLEDTLNSLDMNMTDFRIDSMGRDDYVIY